MADGTLILIVQTGVLLANLVVFGLSLKLYTEILKDQSQTRRVQHSDGTPDA